MPNPRLLEPVSEQDPCGSDLRWDTDFLALDNALSAAVAQGQGAVVAGEVAETGDQAYDDVVAQAVALSTRTKDLRVLDRPMRRQAGVTGAWPRSPKRWRSWCASRSDGRGPRTGCIRAPTRSTATWANARPRSASYCTRFRCWLRPWVGATTPATATGCRAATLLRGVVRRLERPHGRRLRGLAVGRRCVE